MNFTWIEKDELAASACPSSVPDLIALYETGIRAIVTLTEDSLTQKLRLTEYPEVCANFAFLHAPIPDFHAPTLDQVRVAGKFIDIMRSERKPVLVHCLAGQERTGTMLHGYYLVQGFSLEVATVQIESARPQSSFGKLVKAQQEFLQEFATSLA